MRLFFFGLSFVLTGLTWGTHAFAGPVWGDATLKRDDVRVEITRNGWAEVTHTIGIHVASKRFRVFVMEGIDEGAEPPLDEETARGLDGPGWPASATDAKGEKESAFVEPAKEPRRLRVWLGRSNDGFPRGEYTIRLRYRVDLAGRGAFLRDGAFLKLGWSAPRWPEGYDSGRIAFVLPAAPNEPRISIGDGGGADQAVDGIAVTALRRASETDELELTRPHVTHSDDVRWVLRLDAKALPDLAAKLPRPAQPEGDSSAVAGTKAWLVTVALAIVGGLAAGLALYKRDRDAQREACRLATTFRALVPMEGGPRAILFGSLVAAAMAASVAAKPRIAAASLVAAMLVTTLRAPRISGAARPIGRWLAIPIWGISAEQRRDKTGPFDLGGACGRLVATAGFAFTVALVAAFTRAGRFEVAGTIAMFATALVSLFASGRRGQLPPNLVADVWKRLRPISSALDRGRESVRWKLIARMPRATACSGMDEVRLRLEPSTKASMLGLASIEIGCAVVHGFGSSALVPELLVRTHTGSVACVVLQDRLRRVQASATFFFSCGRTEHERVLAIRPAITTPAGIRRWIEWTTTVVERSPKTTGEMTVLQSIAS